MGQELYKLGLVNFVLSAITSLSVETARKGAILCVCVCSTDPPPPLPPPSDSFLSRLPYKVFSERLGKGNFNIAKSILDLIYTQALLWWVPLSHTLSH